MGRGKAERFVATKEITSAQFHCSSHLTNCHLFSHCKRRGLKLRSVAAFLFEAPRSFVPRYTASSLAVSRASCSEIWAGGGASTHCANAGNQRLTGEGSLSTML